MIHIFLADDHEMVRQGIRALIEREPDIRVIGEGGSGKETLSRLTTLRPELVLLDLMLQDMSGLDVLEKMKNAMPAVRVLVLSMYDNKVHLLESLKKGADGYIIKGGSRDELLKAIRSVMSGRRYVSPQLTEYLIEDMAAKGAGHTSALTLREEEVLYFTAEGLKSSDIAEHLKISPRTVEAHRNNMMRKLGLHNKAELIRYAMEHNIHKKP